MGNVLYLAAEYYRDLNKYCIYLDTAKSIEDAVDSDEPFEIYAAMYAHRDIDGNEFSKMRPWLEEVFHAGEPICKENMEQSITTMKNIAKLTGCQFRTFSVSLLTAKGKIKNGMVSKEGGENK